MATLIFLLTVLGLFLLAGAMVIKIAKGRPALPTLKKIIALTCGYIILWLIFYFKASYTPIALGTDVCFDDWCATITQIDKGDSVPAQLGNLKPDSTLIVLHIRMSNHARGIAQSPSEPRIHIIDEKGKAWPLSKTAQHVLEQTSGKQIPFDQRLELHESLQTMQAFMLPATPQKLKVLIEEGPFITKLLFPENKQVFLLP